MIIHRGAAIQTLAALSTFNGHSGVVEDVAWHCRHAHLFGSCGDDKKLIIWDLRAQMPQKTTEAHTAEVNCVAFNPMEEWLLATGSADRTVVLHDIRMLHQRLHVMDAHREEVFQVSASCFVEFGGSWFESTYSRCAWTTMACISLNADVALMRIMPVLTKACSVTRTCTFSYLICTRDQNLFITVPPKSLVTNHVSCCTGVFNISYNIIADLHE